MIFVIVILVVFSSQCHCEVDWCALLCDHVTEHTMCSYKPHRNIRRCTNIEDIQTPNGRKDILHLHNKYRNEIAGGLKKGWPEAANMREMSWDAVSESVALRWAQQCKEGHDSCRRTTEFPYVGQNYAVEGNTAGYPSHTGGFNGWIDEIRMIGSPKSMIKRFRGGKWGHFTQVVWADSFKLGCSETHTELHDDYVYKTTVLICNYGPGGNIWNSKMYEVGKPCNFQTY
ncbi:hypothetical protein GE061_006115 [Apolygus lucorum]|uniref:SCP domain-containing protein n=1 Tax=Apolygus lucorum TaxID=248454 RepID=A0A8S9WT19_APOLU|nr:hypothetical protein GE061_006115 [Apolygus lucorum]